MLPVGLRVSPAQELACSLKDLSVRSYNDLLFVNMSAGFDKGQTVGHPAEIAMILLLLRSNCGMLSLKTTSGHDSSCPGEGPYAVVELRIRRRGGSRVSGHS
jgi:hypothetical protein